MWRLKVNRNGRPDFIIGTLEDLIAIAEQPGVVIVPDPYNPPGIERLVAARRLPYWLTEGGRA